MSPLAPRIRALRASGMSLRAIMAEVGCGYGTAQKHAAGAVVTPVVAAPVAAPKPAFYLHCAGPRACNWPEGDRPFKFCSNDRLPGSPYCRDHHRRAYASRVQVRALDDAA